MKNKLDQIIEIENDMRLTLIAKAVKKGRKTNIGDVMRRLDSCEVDTAQSLDHFAERELSHEQGDLAQENLSEMFG